MAYIAWGLVALDASVALLLLTPYAVRILRNLTKRLRRTTRTILV
jgi:hypothetical protein